MFSFCCIIFTLVWLGINQKKKNKKFVGLVQQNLLSFRILIGIPPADTLSEGNVFTTFLTETETF